jgi:lysyl-tRNA synthetase class 2
MADQEDKAKAAEEFKKQNAQEGQAQSREGADGKKEFLDEVSGEWVSKSELKNRQKKYKAAAAAAKKAEEKKAKEEAKKAAGGGEAQANKEAVEEEEIDPSKYTENRRKWIQAERDAGRNPYPHKFNRDMTIP